MWWHLPRKQTACSSVCAPFGGSSLSWMFGLSDSVIAISCWLTVLFTSLYSWIWAVVLFTPFPWALFLRILVGDLSPSCTLFSIWLFSSCASSVEVWKTFIVQSIVSLRKWTRKRIEANDGHFEWKGAVSWRNSFNRALFTPLNRWRCFSWQNLGKNWLS